MAEARVDTQWDQTASLLALLANVHRDPRNSKVYRPADFHPRHARKREEPVIKGDIKMLKAVFVDRRSS